MYDKDGVIVLEGRHYGLCQEKDRMRTAARVEVSLLIQYCIPSHADMT